MYFSRAILSYKLCGVLSTRCQTVTFCILSRRTIVKVSLDGVSAFADVPFSASVSLGSAFFVFPKVRAWLHDCCSSESHIQRLRWRHGCSGRTLLDSAKISYFFNNCNRLFLFPSRHCKTLLFGSASQRSNLPILYWTWWSCAPGWNPEGKRFLVLVVLELLDQLLDLVLARCILLLGWERSTPDIMSSTVLLQVSP